MTTLDDLVRSLSEAETTGRFRRKVQTSSALLVVDEIAYLLAVTSRG